jgi:recombination protein RecA
VGVDVAKGSGKVPRNKPRRFPVRSPVRAESRAPKIKRDVLADYEQAISKSGCVEVLTLADEGCLANVPLHISTQSVELDRLLNGMGIPCGRTTEIFGPPHIGKSTLLDHLFASVQKMDGLGILIDSEGARDSRYSHAIGVDPKRLQYLEFNRDQLHIENILTKIIETVEFWKAKSPDTPIVIGWDALGGTATRDELEGRLEKNERPAQAAKILRTACRQLPGKLGNTKIALVVCNHEYENIQMGFKANKVGKKRETYGGEAIRHLSSIRLQLFPAGWIKRSDGSIIGREVGVKLVKNRLGNPWGEARVALLSGVGINNVWSVYQRLADAKLVSVSGSWAAINLDGKEMKFQGWSGLAGKCQEDPTLFPRLISVYQSLG